MSSTFRHSEMFGIAHPEGKVNAEGSAAPIGVTVRSIRCGLSDLADAGRLERMHGFAVLPSAVANIGYEERCTLDAGPREAICAACADEIRKPPRSSSPWPPRQRPWRGTAT
jgi:DeoR family glycerol-3-phosphate regulon repressor